MFSNDVGTIWERSTGGRPLKMVRSDFSLIYIVFPLNYYQVSLLHSFLEDVGVVISM